MDERKRFIEDWLASGSENIAGLCRLYQISHKTGYKWLERFRQGGWPALEDRSHAAHTQPRRIAETLERRVVEARRRHPSWGPKKLRAWPQNRIRCESRSAPMNSGPSTTRASSTLVTVRCVIR
jgi:transposase